MFLNPLVLFLHFLCHVHLEAKVKLPIPYEQRDPVAKFSNPNYVMDRKRQKEEHKKPQMPITWNERNHQPFHPAWMDYCDPYHCNDYHKPACGLNRNSMRFKWFQSECHIILNNQCAYHRGLLKYDIISPKFCLMYVMQVRSGCPAFCEDDVAPTCALDARRRPVGFKNPCALEMANCQDIEKYDEVHMSHCDHFWRNETDRI